MARCGWGGVGVGLEATRGVDGPGFSVGGVLLAKEKVAAGVLVDVAAGVPHTVYVREERNNMLS